MALKIFHFLFFEYLFIIHVYLSVSVWFYVHHMCTGAQGGQRESDTMALEVEAVVNHLMWVWLLRIEAQSSQKATRSLNHRGISLAPHNDIFLIALYKELMRR